LASELRANRSLTGTHETGKRDDRDAGGASHGESLQGEMTRDQ
jgi:hypothetical protein